MLRMSTVFTLCPKNSILVCKMLRVHKFTDGKGLLLMIQKLGFLNYIRKQDFNSLKPIPALPGRFQWPIPAIPGQQRHENVLRDCLGFPLCS